MSFSAKWLSTRRSADHRSRNPEIAKHLAQHFEEHRSLRILDLGCGTGANMAATSTLLPKGQHWTMVDNDPELLDIITSVEGVSFERLQADLSTDLDRLFEQRYDLITASALFDLAGGAFMDRLVQHVVNMSAAFFTVLTYDGEEDWQPANVNDATVLSAFHADQHADKGLGPALGPDATDYLRDRFESAGYNVNSGKSDWQLKQSKDSMLIQMLADGIHSATAPRIGPPADDWRVAQETAHAVRVGHKDIVAIPSAA